MQALHSVSLRSPSRTICSSAASACSAWRASALTSFLRTLWFGRLHTPGKIAVANMPAGLRRVGCRCALRLRCLNRALTNKAVRARAHAAIGAPPISVKRAEPFRFLRGSALCWTLPAFQKPTKSRAKRTVGPSINPGPRGSVAIHSGGKAKKRPPYRSSPRKRSGNSVTLAWFLVTPSNTSATASINDIQASN